jgi:hypothetical protein
VTVERVLDQRPPVSGLSQAKSQSIHLKSSGRSSRREYWAGVRLPTAFLRVSAGACAVRLRCDAGAHSVPSLAMLRRWS